MVCYSNIFFPMVLELMFFSPFFGGFLNQGFKEVEVYFVLEESLMQ